MTITILGYRITLLRFERLERAKVTIDRDAARKDAQAIISSESFQALKAQAAAARAARNG